MTILPYSSYLCPFKAIECHRIDPGSIPSLANISPFFPKLLKPLILYESCVQYCSIYPKRSTMKIKRLDKYILNRDAVSNPLYPEHSPLKKGVLKKDTAVTSKYTR